MLQSAINLVKEVLFPVHCVECNAEGTWWCSACRVAHQSRLVTACPICSIPTSRGEVCGSGACQAKSALDGATAFFSYEENGPVGRLIKQFKYHQAHDAREVWRAHFRAAPRLDLAPKESAIIPVPLHPRRARERGFNQAEILAKMIASQYGFLFDERGLARKKYTSQQAKLSRAERHANVAGAFSWRGRAAPPESVLLVDDVFTTGATMQSCARELKNHGTKFVWGITLARG